MKRLSGLVDCVDVRWGMESSQSLERKREGFPRLGIEDSVAVVLLVDDVKVHSTVACHGQLPALVNQSDHSLATTAREVLLLPITIRRGEEKASVFVQRRIRISVELGAKVILLL